MSKGMSYTKVGASLDDLEEGDDDGSPLAMRRAAPCNGVPSASTTVCPRFATAGSLGGIRLLVLVGVVLQNTAYSLARRYSRGTLQEKYSASSALIVMELAKGALSCWKIAYSEAPSDVPAGPLLSKCAFLARHSMTMLVPAAIYLAMNILGFVALQYLDAATFAVLAQMKVLSTAVFSVLILQRRLHVRKWRALTLLTTGVVLLSHEAMPKKTDSTQGKAMSDFGVGVAAVGCEVLLSGFVSIYFEKVLKSKTEVYSVWDRNFQVNATRSLLCPDALRPVLLPPVLYCPRRSPAPPFHRPTPARVLVHPHLHAHHAARPTWRSVRRLDADGGGLRGDRSRWWRAGRAEHQVRRLDPEDHRDVRRNRPHDGPQRRLPRRAMGALHHRRRHRGGHRSV